MQWTHPQCKGCYQSENPLREPVQLRESEEEICCTCGVATVDGIYVRKDPRLVSYPAKEG